MSPTPSQRFVFTREFAQLVWLLVYRSVSTDEQKRALRAVVSQLRDGSRSVSLAELNRSIAEAARLEPTPGELPWLSELATRMAAHSVSNLDFASPPRAADVLGVARVLASAAVHGDEGTNFDARALALGLTTVTMQLGRAGFVRRATPFASPAITRRMPGAPPARTPTIGSLVIADGAHAAPSPDGHEMGIGAPRESVPRSMEASGSSGAGDQAGMLERAFTRSGRGTGLEDLFDRLDEPDLPADSVPALLEELSRAAEDFARDGLWAGCAEVMRRMVVRERDVTDPDAKRAFVIHLRRLCKPGMLRGLAQLMTRQRDLRDDIEQVLVRAGSGGADILTELLVGSNLASERRVYRSAIVKCPAAVEPLLHLMDDHRWYVVRNATELLGELREARAEPRVLLAARHADARVRRAAATALARLGTTRGHHTLQQLLGDANAAVRLQAVHALASARLPRAVPALLQALEREEDAELQLALLGALGAHPTDAAVERLTEAAQPGGFLSRRPAAYRVAAIDALADAGTHAALAALRALQGDRERLVREAVERALSASAHGALAGR